MDGRTEEMKEAVGNEKLTSWTIAAQKTPQPPSPFKMADRWIEL